QDEIGLAAGGSGLVDGDDIRVAQPGEGPGLADEPLGEARVVLRADQLQGDESVERRLAGEVDGPHPAGPDEPDDLQVREQGRSPLDGGRDEWPVGNGGGLTGVWCEDAAEEAPGAQPLG